MGRGQSGSCMRGGWCSSAAASAGSCGSKSNGWLRPWQVAFLDDKLGWLLMDAPCVCGQVKDA